MASAMRVRSWRQDAAARSPTWRRRRQQERWQDKVVSYGPTNGEQTDFILLAAPSGRLAPSGGGELRSAEADGRISCPRLSLLGARSARAGRADLDGQWGKTKRAARVSLGRH